LQIILSSMVHQRNGFTASLVGTEETATLTQDRSISVRSGCSYPHPLIGPAARRSRLPRERFSPLALNGHRTMSV
jgi:hypothetical protein